MQDTLEIFYLELLKTGRKNNRKRRKRMENKKDVLDRLITLACDRVVLRVFSGERKIITSMIDEELDDLMTTLEKWEKERRGE